MSSGMDWFRWHHGTVNDPKFQLVARRAKASVAEVVAVWASLLEAASLSSDRGHPGDVDFEAVDCGLGLDDGKTAEIYVQMQARDLIDSEGRLTAWEKRQPKRERVDNTAAERKARQRAKEAGHGVTEGCHAMSHQSTPRGEERRVDQELESPNGDLSPAALVDAPESDTSGEQPNCRLPCPHVRIIALYHEILPELRQVREWNETRRRLLQRRWSEQPERQSVDWWREFFGYVRRSRFLMGQTTGRDGRPFDCDLEWLIRPTNFAKVVEGKYEDEAA